MKELRFLALSFVTLCCGCASLKPPTIVKNGAIDNYKYIFISPTNSVTSNSGFTYSGQYYSSSTSVNPSEVITGKLTKEGFMRLPEIKSELADQTLIVNYGESGRRNAGLGYTIEVTIQFVSAKTNTPVCACTAEGQGETEADDVRKAINRCLSALFIREN